MEDLTAVQDGRLTDTLSKFLVDTVAGAGDAEAGDKDKKKKKKKLEEMLVVSDPKLGECECDVDWSSCAGWQLAGFCLGCLARRTG